MNDLRGLKVANLRPFNKNSLRGIFDLELPYGGIVLRGCCLHERDGKRWIGWPARPYEKPDGTQSWSAIIDFASNRDKYLLQDEVLPKVLEVMAEAAHADR